jgi:hypothetical protein
MPPLPGGVATAAMVSMSWVGLTAVFISSGCYIAQPRRVCESEETADARLATLIPL